MSEVLGRLMIALFVLYHKLNLCGECRKRGATKYSHFPREEKGK